MKTDRWRQIEDLFEEAANRGVAERATFLEGACNGDPELRAEVESLLEVDGKASAHFSAVVQREAEFLSTDISSTVIGRRIGVYRITGVLGRGGMGTVYKAVRDDDVHESGVALKLVKRGMDTDDVIGRFRQERRILARLQHPNIAHLLDGGTTPEGVPYFVMEFVDGKPITEYAAALPLREKLRLFREVCSAVDHAHRNLVVHRDIKPGNILVTADGVPKLLDFGIAKLLTPEDTSQTRTGLRILTPDYASPEQKAGEPATTATDVFSLGRVLEAMLRTEKTPSEIRVVIDRASDTDPARRYGSVEQLSEDVRRYLAGLPVLARGDTVFYRASKFVGRNKLLVAAVVVAVFSLCGGTAVSLMQAQRSYRQAEHVRKFANKMLSEVTDELANIPGALKARQKIVSTGLLYLDGVAKEIGTDEKLQWELARAYYQIATVQASGHLGRPHLGDQSGAVSSYRAAVRLVDPLFARDPKKAEYRTFLAEAHEFLGVLLAASDECVPHFQRAVALAGQDATLEQVRNRSLNELAAHSLRNGDPDECLRILNTIPRTFTRSLWIQGLAFTARGDLARATAAFTEALKSVERGLPKYPPETLGRRVLLRAKVWAHSGLGHALGNPHGPNLGESSRAVHELRLAIAAADAAAAWERNDAAARLDGGLAYRRLGDVLSRSQWEQSAAAYAKSISFYGQVHSYATKTPNRTDVAEAHCGYAQVCRRLGRSAEAFASVRRSLEIEESVRARYTLGDLMLDAGDRAGALEEYRKALAIAEKRVAAKPRMMPWRTQLADTFDRIGAWHETEGDCVSASEWKTKSLRIWKDWSKWGVSTAYDQKRAQQAERAAAVCGTKTRTVERNSARIPLG